MDQFVHENLSTYGPIAVFLLLMLSAIGISLGEEMVTIPAGVFIATGELELWPTAISAYAAIVIADCIWFALCRSYGTPLLHKRLIKRFIHPRRLLEVKHQFERRGVGLIAISRFVPSSRTTALAVAGIMDLALWRIALVTAACVLVTVPLQLGIGYLIGQGIGDRSMAELLPRVGGLIMLIVVVIVAIGWLTRRRKGARSAPRAKVMWLRRFRVRPGSRTQAGSGR